jgi:peptidoglycan/LPS O-acetylase OafA/YrhL
MSQDRIGQTQYFPALTGLRAIAAYMIFVYHYNPFHVARFPVFHHFIDQLHTGVSLFFVLSGFLLFYRYGPPDQRIELRPYFQNRFAKIYPVFFIFTTLVWIGRNFDDAHAYFANITLLKGLFDNLKFSLIPQTWSLTTEECFYLFLPLIAFTPKRLRYALLLPGFIALGFLLVYAFQGNKFFGFFETNKFMLTYTFFGRCTEFFAGIALAQYFHYRTATVTGSKFTFIGALSLIAVLGLMAFTSSLLGAGGDQLPLIIINNLLFPAAAALLLYGLAKEQTIVSGILSLPVFQLLGKSSYVFYLNPLVLLPFFIRLWMHELPGPLATVVTFIVMVLMSILVYLVIEKPLHRFFSARSPVYRKN